ncbi:MAG: cytochrome c peroxidase [Halioglobus sp.]|nr:cytochrome c peroxidase [Halioglobus sp.]
MSKRVAAPVTIALAVMALLGPGSPDVRAQTTADTRALARIENPPLGLPVVPIPEDNPATTAKIRLGRKLFFDRRLSHNGTMSCGMCHIPEQGFSNNELATPVGTEGRSLRRNAPALYNVAYFRHLFHDGRETRLETQVIAPLLDAREMANPSIGYLLDKIEGMADYREPFQQAFGAGPSIERIGRAIATWERSLVSADSPFDRWHYGNDPRALSPRAIAGFELFSGRAGCTACHLVGEQYATFNDNAFHNTGIGWRGPRAATQTVEVAPGVEIQVSREAIQSVGEPRAPDRGRYEVTLNPRHLRQFKTPGLRNIALTAPYMHDGSLQSLQQVVRYYNRGGSADPNLDAAIKPLGLSDSEVADIVAFLVSLTGSNIAELTADARSVATGNPGGDE